MTVSYSVRIVEPVWIPVRDGTRLAARLWLPEGVPAERFPVVLEYIPYRTFDRYRALDDRWGAILATHGIAFVRVDIRGSGNSEGLLLDEYLSSEQEDGIDVIHWLAAQPWCTGNVGMRGLSWGGFACLQIAALRPSPLKAIVPMCASDDRFRNDAHYVGGLPGLTNLKWAAGFELVMSGPPDPAVVGSRWESMWRERLEATPSIAARWLEHQSNDAYWRHGSVVFSPESIGCPVYLVDGWADPYAQSAERLLRSLRSPLKAIFGPWGHIYPDLAQPGPGLDWASEEIAWWRRWLSGDPAGGAPDKRVCFYVNYATPAETAMKDIPGRWVAESVWPSPNMRDTILHLAPGTLARERASGQLVYKRARIVGLATPEWVPYAPAELPRDQNEDDRRSLVFDCPIRKPMEVVGIPCLAIKLSSDRPLAAIAARLCEVDRDGRSWLVSYGVLNLCFRKGLDAQPSPLEPERSYDVAVEMNPVAHHFKSGSALRLALSDSLWPLVWPSPENATLTIDLAGSALRLPVRQVPSSETPFPVASRQARFSRGNPALQISESNTGVVEIRGAWPDLSTESAAQSTELSATGPAMHLSYDPVDPGSCRWRVAQSSHYKFGDWDCETRVEIVMTATRSHFLIEEALEGFKDRKLFFSRTRNDKIARRFS